MEKIRVYAQKSKFNDDAISTRTSLEQVINNSLRFSFKHPNSYFFCFPLYYSAHLDRSGKIN